MTFLINTTWASSLESHQKACDRSFQMKPKFSLKKVKSDGKIMINTDYSNRYSICFLSKVFWILGARSEQIEVESNLAFITFAGEDNVLLLVISILQAELWSMKILIDVDSLDA